VVAHYHPVCVANFNHALVPATARRVGYMPQTTSVGLVLMMAFVVTPLAAARQWTRTLRGMVSLSGIFGAVGSGSGA